MRITTLTALLFLFCFSSAGNSQELSPNELNFFEAKIRPVLIKECYGCHAVKTGATRGGLVVDSKDGLLRGGDSGPAIVPGDLDESLLWSAINHEDYTMPPKKLLSGKILADFKTWIEMGAPDPRVTKMVDIKSTITPDDIEKGKEFWAFKKPEMPEMPTLPANRKKWAEGKIDQFILAKLEENNLSPATDASPETVLRRLTFDLIGLPPTADQIQWMNKNYKRDPRAAVEHIVDSLLAKPQFGERWGRHWLDLARFAESTGRENNLTFPNAWRYRDYVIDSFNADKPYDRFVQEQIAGDLLPVDTDEQWAENLTATGFLALGPKTLTEQNGRQFRLDTVDEQVDVTSRVVMGVSVACARCHDHKFDPIPQTDYYAMSGIFENTSIHYGTVDTLQNRRPSNLLISPVSDPNIETPKLTERRMEELEEQLAEVRGKLREAQQARIQQRRGNAAPSPKGSDASVAFLSAQAAVLEAKMNAYDEDGNPYTFLMGVQEADEVANTRVLARGEFDQPGQVVDRGFPQVLCSESGQIKTDSSGRLELARWMGSNENPLTARVMVNRIWQHMFGQGIVRTPENFGATGQAPTHPELLDYLALRFVEEGWSVKAMVKEIAMSRAYRIASKFDSKSFGTDPENEFLWRYQPKRLDAEALRDSMLYISGGLDFERPYGSVVSRAGEGLVKDGMILSTDGDAGRLRITIDERVNFRSVYLPVVRDNLSRSMDVFDFAESSIVIGKRESSNTPDQGLYFLNNGFVIEQCDKMARRLMDETSRVEDQVKLAFVWSFGREATKKELQAARDFYQEFTVEDRRSRRDADYKNLRKLSAVCQGIIASAEFRFLN